MSGTNEWDLVVIGGGTAGLVASRTASSFGARVVLIENNLLGGDCLWTGCVPSKSLIAAGDAATTARSSARLGVSSSGVLVDFARVMAHVQDAMHEIAPVDSAESLQSDNIDVLIGRARFTGPNTVDVNGRELRFQQALIATGASPALPDTPGIDAVDLLTSESFWDLRALPERLVVLGGGAIGCEIAQAMARLGSAVTLVHRGPRILPKEDEKASAIIQAALIADGVDVRTNSTVSSVSSVDRLAGTFTLSAGGTLTFDRVLVALGRHPNSAGLDLHHVGVHQDTHGNIAVNAMLRTSNPRIWAAGDVTGLPQFTHTAGVNASVAATNAILGLTRRYDTNAIPRVTFTHPEVGAVGLQSKDAVIGGHRIVTRDHEHVDRAVTDAKTDGYTQLVVNKRGRVLGGTVVGPRAGETLGEISLAVKNRLTTSDIAGTTHAYPTYNDGLWNVALADVRHRLGSGLVLTATRALRRLRSARLR
ncbi:MAG: FAD-dependent oxidoreductase [Cryobacterium sp.]|uniref:dihydrolipoyl dehydrogenase family protein n=1 Tax=unclassified Cryobacterium TaxID=2649013 RepID=UPI0018CA9973|nr:MULTISPECIES: FAD-dependent oxidoreductase [unclassified Cryobacterium]MCY7403508.1 FAD-dependent oxidoreductase [Cryobacterium sp.]MEC5155364.1 pyruvate/2-oxoglutarate dehydrogenase complex dihydrolipoamide dehydrogenase (E3) component [Cryobacterium sp. CAN_C3]